MLLHRPDLAACLQSSTIITDSNIVTACFRCQGLLELVRELKSVSQCSFVTIPSVEFEYNRGANSLKTYNENQEFFNNLIDGIDPMMFMKKLDAFPVVMSKLNAGNPSYTDFLLIACLYFYRDSGLVYLMTADLKAFPSFYDREYLVTIEEDKSQQVRNIGLYRFNVDNYAKAAKSIIDAEK